MPDRSHEHCPDCSEPVFSKVAKKKLWKIPALGSATSPRFPKFQQPPTDFLRFGFVVLSCLVKVKSNSEEPAAAGKPDEILTFSCWKFFEHPCSKNSAIRARARSLFHTLISSFSGHAASAGSPDLVRDRTETARARRAFSAGLSVRAWTERGMKGRDGIPRCAEPSNPPVLLLSKKEVPLCDLLTRIYYVRS